MQDQDAASFGQMRFVLILEEMADVIAVVQKALLEERLSTLEQSLFRQRELCRELELLARDLNASTDSKPRNTQVVSAAVRTRAQNLVLGALLGQLERGLEMLRNARRTPSLIYEVPTGRERRS